MVDAGSEVLAYHTQRTTVCSVEIFPKELPGPSQPVFDKARWIALYMALLAAGAGTFYEHPPAVPPPTQDGDVEDTYMVRVFTRNGPDGEQAPEGQNPISRSLLAAIDMFDWLLKGSPEFAAGTRQLSRIQDTAADDGTEATLADWYWGPHPRDGTECIDPLLRRCNSLDGYEGAEWTVTGPDLTRAWFDWKTSDQKTDVLSSEWYIDMGIPNLFPKGQEETHQQAQEGLADIQHDVNAEVAWSLWATRNGAVADFAFMQVT